MNELWFKGIETAKTFDGGKKRLGSAFRSLTVSLNVKCILVAANSSAEI